MRPLPQDHGAEAALLGSLMLGGRAIFDTLDLDVQDFYKESHRIVWATAKKLQERGEEIDIVTVAGLLIDQKALSAAGGVEYVSNLSLQVPTSANAEFYAARLRKLRRQRQRIALMSQEIETLYGDVEDFEAHIAEFDSLLADTDSGTDDGPIAIDELVRAHMGGIVERDADSWNTLTGVPTGLADFDGITHGLQPGSLVVLAGATSMGKTAMAVRWARGAALAGRRVLFFTLEMSAEEMFQRVLAQVSSVPLEVIRHGIPTPAQIHALFQATCGPLSGMPLHIDDSPRVTIPQIRARARALCAAPGGLDLVIVDYLQILTAHGPGAGYKQRAELVGEMAADLKALARELSVPVVALAQLSREVDRRGEKRPKLSDLRESGAIEHSANLIVFAYRPGYYGEEEDYPNEGQAIVAKHRNGRTGSVPLVWIEEVASYESRAWEDEP